MDYHGRGNDGGRESTDIHQEYLDKMVAFISWLVANGHLVRLIIGDAKYDETAGAMIGLVKYGCGFPFNRLQRLDERARVICISGGAQGDNFGPLAVMDVLGVRGVIMKPFSADEVVSTVEDVLR